MVSDERPHGLHAEREGLHQATGLTQKQRDELIWKLTTIDRWSQRQIARHLKMTQAGVSFALKRMRGETRNRARYDVCDGCGDTVNKDDLIDGLCTQCDEELQGM